MTKQRIYNLNFTSWAAEAATIIMAKIIQTHRVQGACTVMLTGGRSAECLYLAWAKLNGFSELRNVQFYFGDERCVPLDHLESNYGMVMRTLFQHGIPPTCEVIRMAGEQLNHEASAETYAQLLPNWIDVLLLSVGEDGHIASLFPHHSALRELRRKVVPILGSKTPYCRLTITPPTIRTAHTVFVLATGAAKVSVLAKAQLAPNQVEVLPARMVLDANWILSAGPDCL